MLQEQQCFCVSAVSSLKSILFQRDPGVAVFASWRVGGPWCRSDPSVRPPRGWGRWRCRSGPGSCPAECTCTQTQPSSGPTRHPPCVWTAPSPPTQREMRVKHLSTLINQFIDRSVCQCVASPLWSAPSSLWSRCTVVAAPSPAALGSDSAYCGQQS